MMDEPEQLYGQVPMDRLVADEPVLNWTRSDFEQKLGFRGGRFTAVNNVVSFLIAIVLTVLFFVFVIYGLKNFEQTKLVAEMFIRGGGLIPIPTMFLFFWCIAIILIKRHKLAFQRRALDLKPFPENLDFLLNPDTARVVIAKIHKLVDDSAHFLLLNRIERALSNLKNIGRVSDVSEILQTQADYDEGYQDSSYRLVNGFIWAIPVLGFIGTVLGLSSAIGAFGTTVQSAGIDPQAMTESLTKVTGGLSTSFETTLIALVAALIVQVCMTFMQQKESEFLDECNDYCHSHVVSRLRLTN
jgi:biopolymer transport protein ExbB/TolQ